MEKVGPANSGPPAINSSSSISGQYASPSIARSSLNESLPTQITSSQGWKSDHRTTVALSVCLAAFLSLFCISIAAFFIRRRSCCKLRQDHSNFCGPGCLKSIADEKTHAHRTFFELGCLGSTAEDRSLEIEGMPQKFGYGELREATGNFSEDAKLGSGAFGSVYRGQLPGSGIPVAVKKISRNSSQGETEFMAEVNIISSLRHRNLIRLLGWCKDSRQAMYFIVYDLMPNGSLDKALFGPPEAQTACLSWPRRLRIVTGTAAALDYLHKGCTKQVIHRDVKSSNIMLDADWDAKLGDFGLARLVDHQREAPTTVVKGTYGYIAPEFAYTGRFTEKSDVYAFGVVLLEVACGRKALSSRSVPEDEVLLVDWVRLRFSKGDLMSAVDRRLEDYDARVMEVVLKLGLLCSHPDPRVRPTMRHVLEVLDDNAPVPPIPAFQVTAVSSTVTVSTDSSIRNSDGQINKISPSPIEEGGPSKSEPDRNDPIVQNLERSSLFDLVLLLRDCQFRRLWSQLWSKPRA